MLLALGSAGCSPHEPAAPEAAPAPATEDPPPPPRSVDPALTTVDDDAPFLLAAGVDHSCGAIGGKVWCWGENREGQLGRGTRSDPDPVPAPVPGLSDVVELAADYGHTCARTRKGRVWCWGANDVGQLATGDTDPRPSPTLIAGVRADRLFVSYGRACAVEGEMVRCWGRGPVAGEKWREVTLPTELPALAGADEIAFAAGHVCRRDGGTLQCWGDNSSGQIGNGEGGCEYEYELSDCGRCLPPKICPYVDAPTAVLDLDDVKQVALGGSHSYALDSKGHVYEWGQTGVTMSREAHDNYRPQLVEGVPRAVEIDAGSGFACLRTEDGEVWCWGNNAFGTLGHAPGPWGGSEGPARVVGLPPVDALDLGFYFACAAVHHGPERGAWCWGDNGDGQLGDGTQERRHEPVRGLFGR